MKYINIIAEGSSEEAFVNDVLVHHFAQMNKFVSVRKIETGWDRINNKPAKGGLLKYIKLRNDILRWIQSDRGKQDTWYTTFVDLYAFPKDSLSPYTPQLQTIVNPYQKITALEAAIAQDINHPNFIPYVQLHEFEALLMVEPDRLLGMYPDGQKGITRLKRDINGMNPEEINESPQTAPSKRIIKHLPDYAGQKAQVGPMVAQDIGLNLLRQKCPHFNKWITAGIISSPGETSFLFDRGENNRMVPYNIEEVIETDYPTETFQDKYFVIKDKKQLKESVKFMYNKFIK